MRVPLRWLSEYVDLPPDYEELARRLTIAGVEVGEIIRSGSDWTGVTVAQIVDVVKHPDADSLVLATVDRGTGDRQTVVCGAPNVAAGQKVAFAPVGTRLIDGQTGKLTVLKAAVIRGVESAGMICSERELGLSQNHEGILVLDEDSMVGQPLSAVLGDVVFDLDLTPNRPDLLSVLGVAREVAALTAGSVRDPSIEFVEAGEPIKGRARIEVHDSTLCPRYVGALIEKVKIGPSPPWIQERLTSAGMRPINNVVDITNYVMLEMGQPLHAFDFKRLSGGSIIVRHARPAEKLVLIDGSEYELSEDMQVIADAERAIAVAGVMGGADSEVTLKTTTVLLECANFSGPSIRRTSQTLKVRTDASTRFEKGLSRELPPLAAQRAVKLMVEICGGSAAEGMIDVTARKRDEVRIRLTQERLTRVLGIDLPTAQVRQVLTALGFGCRWHPPDHFIVRVPHWRTDVSIADDVIEEVARIIGYDQFPTTQLRGAVPIASPQPKYELRERVRDILAAGGMQEIITYSMTDLETLRKVLPPEELSTNPPLRVANPMSRDFEYARTTLRAGLLRTLAANTHGNTALTGLFEVGRIYLPREEDLPNEVEGVCAAISGRKPNRWALPDGEPVGFYEAKAQLDRLLASLRVGVTYEGVADFAYLPGRTAEVTASGQRIGIVGQLHPRVTADFDIGADVAMFEIDIDALLPHVPDVAHFESVSPYPAAEQDIAIIVDEGAPAAGALKIIESSPLVRSAAVFDVYSGPPVPHGRKSLAFAISFQSSKKTLTEKDVSAERERIVERLKQELGADVRDK